MPYANTGGGTRQSLTPAQAAAKKRKDAARLIQKAVPHMLKQASLQEPFKQGYGA
jgi:hypothetical protein